MLIRPKSMVLHTAEWLRAQIRAGRWEDAVPGVPALVVQCGISKVTAQRALRLLEEEGILSSGGNGRRRRVMTEARAHAKQRKLRIGVILRDRLEHEDSEFRDSMTAVREQLERRGHVWLLVPKTLKDLKFDDERAKRLASRTSADVWIVVGGSRPLNAWLAARTKSLLLMGGGMPTIRKIAMIGRNAGPCYEQTIGKLASLGHRRIVCMLPQYVRITQPNSITRSIHEALRAHGIEPGEFHIPEWEESPAGLFTILESLFTVTPPTAIICSYPVWALAILSFLARKGLRVPEDVSLVCGNHDASFAWLTPQLAHWAEDMRHFTKQVVLWVDNQAKGVRNDDYIPVPVRLIEGQSIGPAKKGH